jgi:hypothetical protein
LSFKFLVGGLIPGVFGGIGVFVADIFWNQFFDLAGYFAIISCQGGILQLAYAGVKPVPVHRDICPYTDFGMSGLLHILAFD